MIKNIFVSIFLLTQSVFSGNIVNYCNNEISLKYNSVDVKYKLCKFETALKISSQNKPDWLFLGIECDDNCPEIGGVTEGLYCHKDGTLGYYELENGLLGNNFNKIEFNEAECEFTDTEATLSVDRYMPNLWLRNQTISYYVSSGINTLDFFITVPNKFTISYNDKDPIIVSNDVSKQSISLYLLISSVLFSFFTLK